MTDHEKQIRNACEEGPYYTAMVAKDDLRALLAALTQPASQEQAQQPSEDVRELSKWLNEECVAPINRQALARVLAASQQPSGGEVVDDSSALPPIIAGAIFDFAGFLTTRPKVTEFGACALASPAVDLLKEWAALRGLSLDGAAVESWQMHLTLATPKPEPMPLSNSRMESLIESAIQGHAGTRDAMRWLARAVEAHHGITKVQA